MVTLIHYSPFPQYKHHASRYLFILVPAIALWLSSCARSPDCFDEEIFCAALVTDTLGINDFGINQDAWAGLQQAQADGNIDEIAYIESVDTRDYGKNIAYFTERGYDLIVTSGIGLDDDTLQFSQDEPDTVFFGINQPFDSSLKNLTPITFPEDQMGFIAGALAARISETRIVGAICETSGIDSMWRYCEGFRAGVAFIDKDIKIHIVYRDDGDREKLFVDEAWGMENAQKLIRRGTDVIFAAGGVTGQGALRAASDAGIYVIGAERDQAAALTGSNVSVVTAIYGDAEFEVREATRLLRVGNVQDVGSGQIKILPLSQKFPENLFTEMNDLRIKLANGEVKINIIAP